MRERQEQILKIICLVLAVLLVVRLVKAVIHVNPLAGVVVPDLPSLPRGHERAREGCGWRPDEAGSDCDGIECR